MVLPLNYLLHRINKVCCIVLQRKQYRICAGPQFLCRTQLVWTVHGVWAEAGWEWYPCYRGQQEGICQVSIVTVCLLLISTTHWPTCWWPWPLFYASVVKVSILCQAMDPYWSIPQSVCPKFLDKLFICMYTIILSLYLCYRLYVHWRFMRGIEAQFLALQKGFNEIIPQHLLRPFDERELEVGIFTIVLKQISNVDQSNIEKDRYQRFHLVNLLKI